MRPAKAKKFVIKPKRAFFGLSMLFSILLALLIPVLSKVMGNKESASSLHDFPNLFAWGIIGLIAGITIGIIGIIGFSEEFMLKLIRLLLLLFIVLSFLMYLAIKVSVNSY
jgi:hypothetical protein